MAEITFDITAVSHSAVVLAVIHARVGMVVRKTLIDLEGAVRRMIVSVGAVDTGNMLNSTTHQMTGELTGEVRVGAEYAVFVEDGYMLVAWGHATGKLVAGRPFVAPAAKQIEPAFHAAIKAAVSV